MQESYPLKLSHLEHVLGVVDVTAVHDLPELLCGPLGKSCVRPSGIIPQRLQVAGADHVQSFEVK